MSSKKRKISKDESATVDTFTTITTPSPSSTITTTNATSTTEDYKKPYMFVLTGVKDTAYCRSIGSKNDKMRFETVSKPLNGGRLSILDSNYVDDWICYVDDEYFLKPELNQNESLAYLLGHMSGFLGLIYGTGVIVFEKPHKCKDVFEATKKWFKLYKDGAFDDDVDLAVKKSSFSKKLSKIE